jgi:hypothetical protein
MSRDLLMGEGGRLDTMEGDDEEYGDEDGAKMAGDDAVPISMDEFKDEEEEGDLL